MAASSSALEMAGSALHKLLLPPSLISRPSAPNSRPRSSRMRFTLLIVAVLATLSSATAIQDNAYSVQITAPPTTFSRPSSTPPPQASIAAPSTGAKLVSVDEKQELRFMARDPQSGGGSPGDDPSPKESDKKPSSTSTASGDHSKTPSSSGSRSITSTASTTVAPSPSATNNVASSPLPAPFDNAPGSAFKSDGATDNCPNFMSGLLSSPDFQSCYPLSLMLQTSTAFFQAEKTLLGIVRVLDATCKADSAFCATYFDAAAKNLTTNCKQEIDKNQTMVLQAYRGLVSYKVLYAATCLQDPKTNQYCFASAVTNLNTPSDTYLYFMPYGLSLPGSSSPSCSWCTQQTMAIFHAAAADRSQFIANTYVSAAQQVNTLCGPNFVNNTLPAASSAAPVVSMQTTTLLSALFAALAVVLTSIL